MILALAASPSLDRTVVVDRLVPSQIHRPTSVVEVAGGKGLNAARAAARLGTDVHAVALLGGRIGDRVADLLDMDGLSYTRVESTAETRICVSVADASAGTLTEFYEPAARVTALDWSALEESMESVLLRGAGWLVLSGSLPPGAPREAAARLVQGARRHGWRTAVDTHGDSLRAALAVSPDLVKVNREEAAEVVGPQGSAGELAVRLREQSGGKTMVVVTAGAVGAVAATPTGTHTVVPARTGTYPVGSGDCFMAGLVSRLEHGDTLPDALQVAGDVATANSLVPGAAIF